MEKLDFWNLPNYSEEGLKYYIVVFTKDSFKEDYKEESRSYFFSTDNKWFKPWMLGTSLFASCVDGTDKGVRLDWYLGEWKIESCYEIPEEKYKELLSK